MATTKGSELEVPRKLEVLYAHSVPLPAPSTLTSEHPPKQPYITQGVEDSALCTSGVDQVCKVNWIPDESGRIIRAKITFNVKGSLQEDHSVADADSNPEDSSSENIREGVSDGKEVKRLGPVGYRKWNSFRKQHAGLGLSRAGMQKLYKLEKSGEYKIVGSHLEAWKSGNATSPPWGGEFGSDPSNFSEKSKAEPNSDTPSNQPGSSKHEEKEKNESTGIVRDMIKKIFARFSPQARVRDTEDTPPKTTKLRRQLREMLPDNHDRLFKGFCDWIHVDPVEIGKKIPRKPGVYEWGGKAQRGQKIKCFYLGESVCLRSRIRQYVDGAKVTGARNDTEFKRKFFSELLEEGFTFHVRYKVTEKHVTVEKELLDQIDYGLNKKHNGGKREIVWEDEPELQSHPSSNENSPP